MLHLCHDDINDLGTRLLTEIMDDAIIGFSTCPKTKFVELGSST